MIMRRPAGGMQLLPMLWLAMCFLLFHTARTAAAQDPFAPLKKRLVTEGFSHKQVAAAYPPHLTPLYKTVSQTMGIRESKLNYDQFLAPDAIARARQFLLRNQGALARAEAQYGADRHVIVAILLVETQLGRYTGRTPTLAMLSTFALMDETKYRDKIWALLPEKDKMKWDREAFDRKLMERSQWAYKEVCALLYWTRTEPQQLQSYKGSVMGAIGWSQFLPSSLVRYGVDGDRDGEIDLFDPEDAIQSIANYLRGYGWCEAKNQTQREQVIYGYNHSRPYIRAVLGVADRLHEGSQ